MEKYLSIVKAALEQGIVPRCHFEDITRADFYGFVVPFASELMKLTEESGIPIKIRACDTMGVGVSYPGASLPRSVPGIIYGLNHFAGDLQIDKRDPIVIKMKELVDKEYAEGRNTAMGDIELDAMLKTIDGETHTGFLHHNIARKLRTK